MSTQESYQLCCNSSHIGSAQQTSTQVERHHIVYLQLQGTHQLLLSTMRGMPE